MAIGIALTACLLLPGAVLATHCTTSVTTPYKSGASIYYGGSVTCPTNQPALSGYAELQRWNSYDNVWEYGGGPQPGAELFNAKTFSVSAHRSCINGLFRTHFYYWHTGSVGANSYSGNRNITC
jgi:hypothetical protein